MFRVPLIHQLEALWKKTTRGEWSQETVQDRENRSAYQTIESDDGILCDTLNSTAAVIHAGDDEGPAHWDQTGLDNFNFITQVHNHFPALVEEFRTLREKESQASRDYRRVIDCLKRMKMPHGTCQPRSRKACAHCNAKDELEEILAADKGAVCTIQ